MRAGVLFGFSLALAVFACRMAHDTEREQPMGPSTAMNGGVMGKPSAAPSAPVEDGGRPAAPEAGRAGHM
jgi:hypothetical protein